MPEMSDRTLCDSTYRSKRLAQLSERAFGLFPYIFQQTDDYGTLERDPEFIKSQRLPRIYWATLEVIEGALQEYEKVGMMFVWSEDGHHYGHFVGFEGRSGKYLSKRRRSDFPTPPAQELAKYLKDNNRFQSVPSVETLQKSSLKLSQVNSSQDNKTPAPSAVCADKSAEETVEEFLDGKTGFGSGGKKRYDEIRDEVKKVCLRWIERLREWEIETREEKEALNYWFPVIQNLIRFGQAKKSEKVMSYKGFFTPPKKAIELINRISKPRDPIAALSAAFREQPKYLRH